MSTKKFNISFIKNSRSLTNDLVISLRKQILEGNLIAGAKLPTAKEIEEQAGVSRSVVREAIAALKAERLIISRQGVGVFVAKGVENKAFEIEANEFSSFKDAIQILELRMAVELEMSAMAARNRTTKQMSEIWDSLAVFNQQVAEGNDIIKEDSAFHLSIAKASGNPYFSRFIDYISSGAIPSLDIINTYEKSFKHLNYVNYLELLQQEHQTIAQAIEAQSPEEATQAIRTHLGNSLERHLKISHALKLVK